MWPLCAADLARGPDLTAKLHPHVAYTVVTRLTADDYGATGQQPGHARLDRDFQVNARSHVHRAPQRHAQRGAARRYVHELGRTAPRPARPIHRAGCGHADKTTTFAVTNQHGATLHRRDPRQAAPRLDWGRASPSERTPDRPSYSPPGFDTVGSSPQPLKSARPLNVRVAVAAYPPENAACRRTHRMILVRRTGLGPLAGTSDTPGANNSMRGR